tara:strand:+ start:304 stop:492 length:189 start_codon:yes stop_codon:yes gene_type:complete
VVTINAILNNLSVKGNLSRRFIALKIYEFIRNGKGIKNGLIIEAINSIISEILKNEALKKFK